jgi:hypothetical protein
MEFDRTPIQEIINNCAGTWADIIMKDFARVRIEGRKNNDPNPSPWERMLARGDADGCTMDTAELIIAEIKRQLGDVAPDPIDVSPQLHITSA